MALYNEIGECSSDPADWDDEDEDESGVSPKYCQWGTSDGKIFMPSSKTVSKLTPGVYEIDMSPQVGL